MIKRIGKVTPGDKVVHAVDEFEFDGVLVKKGDLVELRTKIKGLTVCHAKVARIDLVEPGGPVKEVTVGVWTTLSGKTHAKYGMTRVVTAEAITPLKTQPRWALVPVDSVEGVDPSDGKE